MAIRIVSLVLIVSGCGFGPIGPPGATDAGFLGCQIAAPPGVEVRDGVDPLAPGEPLAGVDVGTMTPAEVGMLATARNLRVTWRYQYWTGPAVGGTREGFSECWCVPPPEGRVGGVSYGMANELVVMVVSGETVERVLEQPVRGWGC